HDDSGIERRVVGKQPSHNDVGPLRWRSGWKERRLVLGSDLLKRGRRECERGRGDDPARDDERGVALGERCQTTEHSVPSQPCESENLLDSRSPGSYDVLDTLSNTSFKDCVERGVQAPES